MRHVAACIGVLLLTGLCLHTVALNVHSRQTGYRIAENLDAAESLRKIVATRRERCRELLEMEDVQAYARHLGLTESMLLPRVVAADDFGAVAAAPLPAKLTRTN